ncbi:MAG TPA: C39 family peptidase [Anaerolineaceae bacterium]
MKRNFFLIGSVLVAALFLVGFGVTHIPSFQSRVNWREEIALAYLRGMVNPAGKMPTPLPAPHIEHHQLPSPTPDGSARPDPIQTHTSQPTSTATPAPTPTFPPLPASAKLAPPQWEKQDANNCGPATLSIFLHFYGWTGVQSDINKVIKPDINDRNVNIDELVYFVRTHAGWLKADYHVGGNEELIKRFISNGIPFMIEETSILNETYWPGDDHWAGHYLLITGYDNNLRSFTVQDSWLGPNLSNSYDLLDTHWQAFNRAYVLLYRPEQEDLVKRLLGSDWDEAGNRTNALDSATQETLKDPRNPYAWFNKGTNLLYFERWSEAAEAYDTARQIGLPQRMLRYQFGPFIAYFKTNRIQDLVTLGDYALKITPNSEEDLLWHGWGVYLQGDKTTAIDNFRTALKFNPTYQDAKNALNTLGVSP